MAAKYTEQDVLDQLDHGAAKAAGFPCLGNMNLDYLATRLHVFGDENRWALAFNSIVWWPAYEGLHTVIESVGNCVRGEPLRAIAPGAIEMDYDEDSDLETVTGVTVRGVEVPVSSLKIKPEPEISEDVGFWTGIALLERHGDKLFAMPKEVAAGLPGDLLPILTLNEWLHPDVTQAPSASETFRQIAKVIVTGDPSAYRAPANPNTHWRHWVPK